jgi:hypothetical protein
MSDFDWEIYLFKYPDLIQQGIRTKKEACLHYQNFGFLENRNCSLPISFDAEKYMRLYRHIGLKTPKDAYLHYMKIGAFFNKVKKHLQNDLPMDLSIFQQKKELYPLRKPKAPEAFHPVQPTTKPKPHLVSHRLVALTNENYSTSTTMPQRVVSSHRRPAVAPKQLHPVQPNMIVRHKPLLIDTPSQTSTTPVLPLQRRRPIVVPKKFQPLASKTRQSPIVQVESSIEPSLPQPIPITLPRRKPLILSKPLRSEQPTTNIVLPVIQQPVPVMKKPPPYQNTFKPIRQSKPLPPRSQRAYRPSIVNLNSKKPISPLLHTILTKTRHSVRQPKPNQLVLQEPPSSYFARLGVLGPPKYLN